MIFTTIPACIFRTRPLLFSSAQVLSHIACSSNVYDIVSELTEYARDISPALGREAVCAVGRIALAVQDVSGIVERLLGFLDSGADHIIAETLVQVSCPCRVCISDQHMEKHHLPDSKLQVWSHDEGLLMWRAVSGSCAQRKPAFQHMKWFR